MLMLIPRVQIFCLDQRSFGYHHEIVCFFCSYPRRLLDDLDKPGTGGTSMPVLPTFYPDSAAQDQRLIVFKLFLYYTKK